MRKIYIFIVVLLFLFNSKNVSAVTNSSYILLDYESGRVMYEKNIHQRFLTASISKILTAMVAIENGMLFDLYKVDRETTLIDGSKIYLEEDDQILLYDLVHGLMMRSGNDAATLIAKNIFGSEKRFVYEMNQLAKKIGMGNSTFENPTGLNDDTFNYSTAYDMALLMRYAMNNEVFRGISSKKIYRVKTLNNSYVWTNKHKLMQQKNYVISGKTGYTKLCGRTLVSYAEINDMKLIAVSFNEGSDYNLHNTLFIDASKEFEKKQLYKKGVYPQELKELNYYPKLNNTISILIRKNGLVYGKFNLLEEVKETCGNLEIYEDNKLIYSTVIYPYYPNV